MSLVDAVSSALGILGGAWLVLGWLTYGLRKPKIEVLTDRAWVGNDPVPWHFAIVDIRNADPPRWVPFLSRETAFGCEVSIQFYRHGEAVTEAILARWSDRPEPIAHQLATSDAGEPIIVGIFAPTLVPDSKRLDLPAGGRRQEVAVAVLGDDEAYGWGAESYAFPEWRNPDWKFVERGEYDVHLAIQWGGGSKAERLALSYLSDDASKFRLVPLHSSE